MKTTTLAVLIAALLTGLSACHNSSPPPLPVAPTGSEPPPDPPLPPPQSPIEYGLFYGHVTVSDEHYARALLTADGDLRIQIGDTIDAQGSAQFVGEVELVEYEGFGSGIVIGQNCAISDGTRFCQGPASADIDITTAGDGFLSGAIRVVSEAGVEESWPFELNWTSPAYLASELSSFEGLYQERQAEFAIGDAVVMSIDNSGRLFFQAPSSGCVGNGAILQNLARGRGVFDATVDIANCNEEFSSLNGAYEGLAIQYPSDFYYDAELTLFLSTLDGAASRTALTMWSVGI